jgi:diphthamide synthase (EF-2-diphthine--ammonia ligase)
VIVGDIPFDGRRRWAEPLGAPHRLVAVEPLFGSSTTARCEERKEGVGDVMVVTARAACLDESWLGRRLARAMLARFEALGVDPCGGRGESEDGVGWCQTPSDTL